MNAREIMKEFYSHPYTREAVESASKRHGCECRVKDDPINGVVMITDDPNGQGPIIVELNEAEKSLLLIAVGKAFAELVKI